MDRRSFITSVIGGFAAASLGGIAVTSAAPSEAGPSPAMPDADAALATSQAEALDRSDAEYSQYYHRRRRHHRRPPHRRYNRRYYRGHSRRPDRRTGARSQR